MSLSAREWLLLPEKEQKSRKGELSLHESFLLRTSYEYIHFTEDEKMNMTEEEKKIFINPPSLTEEEKEKRRKSVEEGFRKLLESAHNEGKNMISKIFYCPILQREISDSECFDISMVAERMAPERTVSKEVRSIENYKEICLKCKDHNYN